MLGWCELPHQCKPAGFDVLYWMPIVWKRKADMLDENMDFATEFLRRSKASPGRSPQTICQEHNDQLGRHVEASFARLARAKPDIGNEEVSLVSNEFTPIEGRDVNQELFRVV